MRSSIRTQPRTIVASPLYKVVAERPLVLQARGAAYPSAVALACVEAESGIRGPLEAEDVGFEQQARIRQGSARVTLLTEYGDIPRRY